MNGLQSTSAFVNKLLNTTNKYSTVMRCLLFIFLFSFITNITYCQSANDTTAIKNAALNYIEGWYNGNAERMSKAVHPKLAKRLVAKHPENGKWVLSDQDSSILIKYTKKGAGTRIPENKRRKKIKILDIFQDTASVKIIAASWVDYLHMAKWKGEWKIINVLWEKRN